MERRKQKFSQDSINKIKGNYLLDATLLSRSQGDSNLGSLMTNQTEREKFLTQIKETDSTNLKEHGLRKLREIVVSIFNSQRNDSRFIQLMKECYQLSYALFLDQKKFNQIGGVVLPFLVENLPKLATEMGYLQLYILYLSHWKKDILKSIDCLLKYKSLILSEEFTCLMQLSLTFCERTNPPSEWLKLLAFYKDNKDIMNFFSKTNIILQVQNNCLTMCQKSYNQLSLIVFKELWLQNIPLESEVEEKARGSYLFETLSNGSEMIYFKKKPVA
ncbi:hypothetical protein C6P44_004643 [Monosporozyma unispora]|nr:hypothetical protein C6P44_004643 [Kazachstania unispora]